MASLVVPQQSAATAPVADCDAPDADPELPEVPEPIAESDDCGRPSRGPLRRAIRTVVTVVATAGFVWLLVSSRHMASQAWTTVRAMPPWALVAALTFEVTCFGLLSVHLRLLAGPRENAKRMGPFRLALLLSGLGASLPAAPAEGMAMAADVLQHRHLARRRTLLVLGCSQLSSTTGIYLLASVNALVVVTIDARFHYRWALAAGAVIVLITIASIGFALSHSTIAEGVSVAFGKVRHRATPAGELRERGRAWHAAAMHIVATPGRAALLLTTAAAAWFADALCLHFAVLGVGGKISVTALLLAYTATAIAAAVPLLPAGLGIVETLTPAILHLYGVPVTKAVIAVVVYRVIGTLLPAIGGAVSLGSLRLETPPEPLPVAAS